MLIWHIQCLQLPHFAQRSGRNIKVNANVNVEDANIHHTYEGKYQSCYCKFVWTQLYSKISSRNTLISTRLQNYKLFCILSTTIDIDNALDERKPRTNKSTTAHSPGGVGEGDTLNTDNVQHWILVNSRNTWTYRTEAKWFKGESIESSSKPRCRMEVFLTTLCGARRRGRSKCLPLRFE